MGGCRAISWVELMKQQFWNNKPIYAGPGNQPRLILSPPSGVSAQSYGYMNFLTQNGSFLATMSYGSFSSTTNHIVIINTLSGATERTIASPGTQVTKFSKIAMSATGNILIACNSVSGSGEYSSRYLKFYDWTTGGTLATVTNFTGGPRDIAISFDGTRSVLVTDYVSGFSPNPTVQVCVYNSSGSLVWSTNYNPSTNFQYIPRVAISPNGKYVYLSYYIADPYPATTYNQYVRIYDVDANSLLWSINNNVGSAGGWPYLPNGGDYPVGQFSGDSQYIIIGAGTEKRLFKITSGSTPIATFNVGSTSGAFFYGSNFMTLDGTRCFYQNGGTNGGNQIVCFVPYTGEVIRTFPNPGGSANSIPLLMGSNWDGSIFAFGAYDADGNNSKVYIY